MHANYASGENFVIKGLDSSLQDTDLYVNTIGAYDGIVAVDFGDSQTAKLQISASGPWHLDIKEAKSARSFSSSVSGQGDDVLLYSGSGGIATIANQGGSSNFVMKYYSSDSGGADLLVNEIGPYNGQQPITSGPGFVEVTSDGHWTISIR